MNPITKLNRHTVNFVDRNDAQAVALAKIGVSNSVITQDCKLSAGQIQYRLRKARDLEGQTDSFRKQWRNGTSMAFRKVRDDIVHILRREAQDRLPRLLGEKIIKTATTQTK